MREFRLPDVGEGVAEGEIVRWLVSVGDTVTEDQPVAEVETDKAIVEIPAPVDGTVAELRAEEGEIVPVGEVIIVFDTGTGDEAPADAAPVADGEPQPAANEAGAPVDDDGETATDPSERGRVFAPPHVRRLARELDVHLSSVDGSGPGGRVTESDVRAAAEGEAAAEPAPETAEADVGGGPARGAPAETGPDRGTGAPSAADRDRTLAAPATRGVARELGVDLDTVPAVEQREGGAYVTAEAVREYADARRTAQPGDAAAVGATAAGEREERVPYRGIRRTIGEHMEESAFTAPHVTHHDIVDVAGLVRAREEMKPRAADRGISLTYLPFVMKAVVAALKEFPDLNASLDEEAGEVVRKHYYHLGVATATDEGLLVPVVRNVDQKGLLQVASEVSELSERARERSLSREEMQGGTFSITNVGAIGGEYGTPIINYPEVAILALGAIRERPWVEEGEVVARHTLPLSLSFDHRVLDGAEASRFTNRLKEYLRTPALLLFE